MRTLNIRNRVAVLSFALVFLHLSPLQAEQRALVTVGTGGPTGIYFAVGNSVCRMVHKEAAAGRKAGREGGIRCAAPSTAGSAYNVGNIQQNELDFGVVQSDLQHHAYTGTSMFEGQKFEDLRALFSVHSEPFHLVVRHDSGINSWSDLKGKRVNIGNPGSGQRGTMEALMAAYGTSVDDFEDVAELTSTEQPKALCRDKIDVFGYTVGVPNAGVALATDGCNARIISLDSEVEHKLVADNPFYTSAVIPAGTYRTSTTDVNTFGVFATVVAAANQPDDIVYEVVRAVFENFDDFKSLHPAFADLDPIDMISKGLSAPLHPGAVRYYREKGWM